MDQDKNKLTDEEKIIKLKLAIDKMLRGINFSLDENVTRKAISNRLKECRTEAIKILKDD